MRYLKLTLLCGLLLSSVSVHALTPKKEISEYSENKLAVMLTQDQPQFVIKLKSNPTTGYSWYLREYNAALIEPVSHFYQAPINKRLMGASGHEVWTFRAKPGGFIVPQQTMLRLVYSRPWEANDTTTQLFFKVSTAQGKQ